MQKLNGIKVIFLVFFLIIICVSIFASCKKSRNFSDIMWDLYNSGYPNADENTSSKTQLSDTPIPSVEDINLLREDYDLGTCRKLEGNVSVIIFYMDDFESGWTEDEMSTFGETEVIPGLVFLEEEARRYGIKLKFDIKQSYLSYYDDNVIKSVKETGLATIDVLKQAAQGLGYFSDEEMLEVFKEQYNTEIVCVTVFNKNGTSYAINPNRGSEELNVEEHCIIFARDIDSDGNAPSGSQASIIAHEMLHLYGAEDYYSTPGRKALARKYYPHDIMLGANYYISTNNIGGATAFYVGWTDVVPDVLNNDEWT